jgi:glyoxylase-like metal-dependent hydrolase (beta-lactamase superfamily II)
MELRPEEVSHVFLTHAHLPHAGAAEDLRKNGVEVVAGPETAAIVKEGGLGTAAYHYHRRFVKCREVTVMEPGESMELGIMEVTAVPLPGHSADSTGWRMTSGGRTMLFCGDAVRSPALEQFRNRPDYDRESYLKTLRGLLEDPPDVLYPGHGPFCLSRTDQWIAEEIKKLLRRR